MKHVGIISCRDYWKKGCPGYSSHFLCFLALERNKGPLGQLNNVKIVSMHPCPGCPGTGRIAIARRMIEKEEVSHIVFPSCIFFNNHCPTAFVDAEAIESLTGRPVLLGSYLSAVESSSCPTVLVKPKNVPTLTQCWEHLLHLNYLQLLSQKKLHRLDHYSGIDKGA